MRIGIIDLGSNSARLLVVDITHSGAYQVVTEAKSVLRLASAFESDGCLGEVGLAKSLAALQDFTRIGRAHGVTEYVAVATAAVRQAKNGQEFTDRLTAVTGVPLRIISEAEEAQLGYTGALNTLALNDGLLIDLGGASMELVRFSNRQITASTSLPFGSVNLTERFLPHGSDAVEAYKALGIFIGDLLSSVPWLHTAAGLPLVGVGGTVRNLGRVDRKRRHYPMDTLHNYRMPPAAVEDVTLMIRNTPVQERRKIPGLSEHRVDIMATGASVIWQALTRSGSRELVVSGAGVREGLLYRKLLTSHRSAIVQDVLDFSLLQLLHSFGLNLERARETTRLALCLWDQIPQPSGKDDWVRRSLYAAAMLSEIGVAVNAYSLEQHTFYLIARGRLYGLTHREMLVTGAAAGFRGMGKARELLQPYASLLDSKDEEVVRSIGVSVAITRELLRYEIGSVRSVRVECSQGLATIGVESDEPLSSAQLMAIQAWENDFRKAFQCRLVIQNLPLS